MPFRPIWCCMQRTYILGVNIDLPLLRDEFGMHALDDVDHKHDLHRLVQG